MLIAFVIVLLALTLAIARSRALRLRRREQMVARLAQVTGISGNR
jgi:hypothetical protein